MDDVKELKLTLLVSPGGVDIRMDGQNSQVSCTKSEIISGLKFRDGKPKTPASLTNDNQTGWVAQLPPRQERKARKSTSRHRYKGKFVKFGEKSHHFSEPGYIIDHDLNYLRPSFVVKFGDSPQEKMDPSEAVRWNLDKVIEYLTQFKREGRITRRKVTERKMPALGIIRCYWRNKEQLIEKLLENENKEASKWKDLLARRAIKQRDRRKKVIKVDQFADDPPF